jgi:hypothetical protein
MDEKGKGWQVGDEIASPDGLVCTIVRSERYTNLKIVVVIACPAGNIVTTGAQKTLEGLGWQRED